MPLGKAPLPDHRELHFSLTGPLKFHYFHEGAKLEGWCHHCRWSCFEWTEPEAKAVLLRHIWDAHSPQPKPQSNNLLPPPGRR